MNQSVDMIQTSSLLHQFNTPFCTMEPFQSQLSCHHRIVSFFKKKRGSFHQHCQSRNDYLFDNKVLSARPWESGVSDLPIQTLRRFPREKLFGETVLLRIDIKLLLKSHAYNSRSAQRALTTITYLYDAGASVLLVSNWGQRNGTALPGKAIADCLSSILQIKVVPVDGIHPSKWPETINEDKAELFLLDNLKSYRSEIGNCSKFAKKLSTDVGIFVNDDFSQSHKILASTVGVARFCYSSIAGFHFEEELVQLMGAVNATRQPFFSIIGGGNFSEKKDALHLLASKCDGLIFVGKIAFQIMHALGLSLHEKLVEHHAVGEVQELIQLAGDRNIPIILPKDFYCAKDECPELLDIFPAEGIPIGWTPADLGPMTLNKIDSMLSKCKKILCIGPLKFCGIETDTHGEYKLSLMLEEKSKTGCDVIVIGKAACKAASKSRGSSSSKHFDNAAAVWDFLKGRSLPGVAALDRAYPFGLVWRNIFGDPTRPLIVDVGSGNGLFVLEMAQKWCGFNFLGLEINEKLVRRCLESISQRDLQNGYFVSTNATHTFRPIVSSYPGELILVSIQCPNPDFNKQEHRWRMVQRALVEAIIDLLARNGKIFLQSDVVEVAIRMKDQFMTYGKDVLVIDHGEEWIKENPLGIMSDWERHVLDRGAPMYRTMIRKDCGSNTSGSELDLSTFL